MLQKESDRLGLSKSAVVEEAIKKFLEKQLIKDAKKLATLTFDDLPSSDDWLKLDAELDQYET